MRRSAARVRGGVLALALGAAALAPGGPAAPRGASAQSRQVALGSDSAARAARWGDVLGRVVTIHLADTPMESALRYIAQMGGLRLSYSSDIVPVSRRVTISRVKVPVGDVLREALRGTDLDFVLTPAGYVVIVRSPSARPVAADDSGSHAALSRVAVRPQVMDRVLVMGTPAMGAPERELATAVTVLTASQIAQSGASSMMDLFRSGIPGVVAWDLGITGPFAQIGSVRGASSFTSNYLKTYVDGIELASPYLLFAIDPSSIERIEVIRGPQGSALYGSDAISGVVQVVTRRGSISAAWHPQLDLGLSAGIAESKYVTGTSPLQRYTGFASTGGGTSSLGFGGTYESSGEIAPGGGSSYRGTFGGLRHLVGPLRLEGSMRYADVRFTAAPNPFLNDIGIGMNAASGDQVRPLQQEQRIQNETYGATVDYQPFAAWRQTVVVGIDRHAGAIPSQREPATVADILLGANSERVSKSSVRYSTALRLPESPAGSATLTLGAEHAALTRERLGSRSDVVGDGTGLTSLYTDEVKNTGVFGQLKVDVAHSLFLTGGLRGEHNSSFGRFYQTAWSPMVGAAYTRDVGTSTYKVRWAYGKGIRPPPSSARRAIQTVSYRQLENPDLEPEVQGGAETGLEWYAGDRASLSVTGYRQSAEGLVQQVIIARADRNQLRSIQYQNVGRIENQGVELEGAARAGDFRAAMSFALTDSRVRALSATYRGELRIGDRVPEVPQSSGVGTVTWERGGLRLTLGGTYIGGWLGYDWLAFYNDELGTTAPRALRDYLIDYPPIFKPYVSLTRALGRGFEGYLRVDNLENDQRNERDNLQVVPGRTAIVGIRIGR